MKNGFLLLFALMLPCLAANAQGYFCEKAGAKLEYVRNYPDSGKFRWRHILEIGEIETTPDYRKVTTTSAFLKQNGKKLYDDVREHVLIDRNNDVWTDMGEAVASYIKSRIGLNMSWDGILTSLPSDAQPGDTLQPVVAHATLGPIRYTVKAYDRRVLREETISLPAGTFRCIVVREKRTESGPGHNRKVMTVTWYSKGVGYVRHDTYVKDKLETSEILHSMKNE